MSKRPRSPMQRLPLWQWGLLVIVAALVANVAMTYVLPTPSGSAAARGQAFGRGVATLLGIIAGGVLIIMHFVRRNRKIAPRKKSLKPRKSRR